MSLDGYLSDCASRYDQQKHLLWAVAKTPGYHTRIKDGTVAYPTRDNMDYVIGLLMRGESADVARAHDIMNVILPLQQTDPTEKHFGIWGWYCEELPQQMDPADWNWADFIGARIAQILVLHDKQLRSEIKEKLRIALKFAALSIFRRNVNPDYTNIGIMGAVVTGAAGEILNDSFLLNYGRVRLNNVLDLAEKTGGFTEYNSPTYTRVAIEEVERALMMIRDPQFRSVAEKLRYIGWRMLAERFHPATGQMAGPHARAYSDWVPPTLSKYLSEQTGADVQPHVTANKPFELQPQCDLVTPLPCPADLAERFKKLPADPLEVTTRFAISAAGDIVGTTWLTQEACFGSVNRGIGWIQQRATLGYWRTEQDSAIAIKTQMLLNGHELSSSRCRQKQKGPRLLSAWQLLTGGGHHHPSLNRPEDSVFEASELALRISIQGRGVQARKINESYFELSAGHWRAIVHAAGGEFLGHPVIWEIVNSEDLAAVQAVLYRGNSRRFDFHQVPLKLAFAMELLEQSQSVANESIHSEPQSDGRILWQWRDLSVISPTISEPI